MPDAPTPTSQRTPPMNLPIAGSIPPAPTPVPASAPIVPKPATPEPPQYTAQIRTMAQDAGGLHIGQHPSGTLTRPGELAPALPKTPAIIAPAPQDAPSSLMHKVLYAVSGVVVIGILWAIATSIFGNTVSDNVVPPTPTPVPSTTALPSRTPIGTKTLESYLGVAPRNINLEQGSIASALALLPQSSGKVIAVTPLFNGQRADARVGLQTMFSAIPTALLDAVASEWTLATFGQTELFSAQGQAQTATTPQGRTVVIVELANVSAATAALASWETSSLVSSAASVLGYTATTPALQQGTYNNIAVRYQNFPTADRSVDYAIVLAKKKKNYLVITASRQSLFATIDLLRK